MASHPPAQCCTVGVKHEGEPTGTFEVIEDIETYIALPPSTTPTPHPHTALLLLTDVIGHRFPNAQLIADQLAQNGYPTYIPDLFFGDAIPLNRPANYDLQAWLKGLPTATNPQGEGKGHAVERTEPVVRALVRHLREELGVKNLGVLGYCFGAKYAIRALGDGGADAAFVAHPSWVAAEEVRAIKGPLSIAAAETDRIFPAEKRHETEGILGEVGRPWQVCLYSGVEHGFAVRGEVGKKDARFAKERAFVQAVAWFDEWLV
ncbi:hypothetical protein MMC30_008515 [Trapelia coarctata]|nr:hypothetical protein [Trapelia coarctata]